MESWLTLKVTIDLVIMGLLPLPRQESEDSATILSSRVLPHLSQLGSNSVRKPHSPWLDSRAHHFC
jgi:hypothetical protein